MYNGNDSGKTCFSYHGKQGRPIFATTVEERDDLQYTLKTKTLLRYFYPGTAWHMHSNWNRHVGDLSDLGRERYNQWIVTHAPKLTAVRWVLRETIRRNDVIFMLEAEKHGPPKTLEFVRWRLSHAVRANCDHGSGFQASGY